MADTLELVWSALGGAFVTFAIASIAWGFRVERKVSVMAARLEDHPLKALHERIQRIEFQMENLEPVLKLVHGRAAAATRPLDPDDQDAHDRAWPEDAS